MGSPLGPAFNFYIYIENRMFKTTEKPKESKHDCFLTGAGNEKARRARGISRQLQRLEDSELLEIIYGNRRNNKCLCEDKMEVPTMMHMKFTSSVMIPRALSHDGYL